MVKTHGLTHLALSVADPDRSLRFYSSEFGVRAHLRDVSAIRVLGPGPHDVIAFERRPGDAGAPGGIIHFGFRLIRPEDIDAAVAAVESAGGSIASMGGGSARASRTLSLATRTVTKRDLVRMRSRECLTLGWSGRH